MRSLMNSERPRFPHSSKEREPSRRGEGCAKVSAKGEGAEGGDQLMWSSSDTLS